MSPRLIFVLQLLLLAGCATTGSNEIADEGAEMPIEEIELHSSTATIDEHLFIPETGQAPVAAAEAEHVHDHIWERLVHSFALPECSEQEISRNWAQWYADRPAGSPSALFLWMFENYLGQV